MDDPCDKFYLVKGAGINGLHGMGTSEDADGIYRKRRGFGKREQWAGR